jgi:predicted NBD/HSP70 family sugar kinase
MNVLVIDIGGTQVKLFATGQKTPRRFTSGNRLTPSQMISRVKRSTARWRYDVVSLGYPGKVDHDGPAAEPGNLAHGWLGFDFEDAFGCPVRIVNDAALQALGAYDGGRMLFLGLGTGLGSALVAERVVIPLELGSLMYGSNDIMSRRLGKRGLHVHGKRAWHKTLERVTASLREAFVADYIVLGGGNSTLVDPLPPHVRRGGNDDAFAGGFRLWEERVEPHDAAPSTAWRVVV